MASYITLYRRARGTGRDRRGRRSRSRIPLIQGELDDIQAGDVVSYFDKYEGQYVSGVVDKVNIRAEVLRLKALVWKGTQLRPARRLTFDDIMKLERARPVIEPDTA
jgi:hypothetical protein